MTYPNNDLVEEILVRLPVRSLLRLKSVCKSWCDLINSPAFIHMHMLRQRTSGEEFILVRLHDRRRPKIHPVDYTDYTDLKTLSYFQDFESLSRSQAPPQYEVLHHKFGYFAGHSNGIVCISDGEFNVFLFNPALREIRPLPIIPSWRSHKSYEHAVGFGFDEATNDYKVVRITKTKTHPSSATESTEVEIYNLRTNSWRQIGPIAGPPSIFNLLVHPVYFRGLIHWVIWRQLRMLTFNTTTELFKEMSIPVDGELFIMDDSALALVAYTSHVEEYGWAMDVWVMKEYSVSESWARLYSVPPPSTYIERVKLLSFCTKDKLVMVSSKGDLICYDSATGLYSQIRQLEDIEVYGYPSYLPQFEIVACHESLFSTYNANLVL